MSKHKKNKDIFSEAIKELEDERVRRVKEWQFINWICSKEPILQGENAITPIEKTNI